MNIFCSDSNTELFFVGVTLSEDHVLRGGLRYVRLTGVLILLFEDYGLPSGVITITRLFQSRCDKLKVLEVEFVVTRFNLFLVRFELTQSIGLLLSITYTLSFILQNELLNERILYLNI